MKRHYLSPDFKITSWDTLKPLLEELKNRSIQTADELLQWLKDHSELEAVISEDGAWRYIRMTCDTKNEQLQNDFNFFVTEIEPHLAPYANELNKKLVDSPFINALTDEAYRVYIRGVKKNIELFREKNIPLQTELRQKEQEFGSISAAQSIRHEGEEMTLQKAATFFKNTDRSLRETIYKKIQERRGADEKSLNELYDELIKLRNQIALNTGFKNYRDYKHEDLGRFDYSVQDCFNFHDAIQAHIVPLVKANEQERKDALRLDSYRPWDREVDVDGKAPLKPFTNGKDLTDKTIDCFKKVDPYFADCITTMNSMKRLDLESRIGKAPGGYNYPLMETDVPFIFMNAVGLHRDMVTMVHEGGHAVHAFLAADLELTEFKSTPSEVAELASMSMELISMEHWESFFPDKDDLKRARKEQLDKVLQGLPWIAQIDKFQHWVYENPGHSHEERYAYWMKLCQEFGTGVVDYTGLENNLKRSWQVQLHLYEVPFYYIEYGMAQLGAIAVWRNYKKNPAKGLEQYKAALKLGYTRTIPEIYKAAGIEFNFSPAYVKELADFVKAEYEALK
ncbi:MAG: M3 family oligoendopeptidase [Bacteroidetes bacterium]|nr:M3 family oligoendopeptidase [Bacteroidota bacterium]